jgi:hypothetical protein
MLWLVVGLLLLGVGAAIVRRSGRLLLLIVLLGGLTSALTNAPPAHAACTTTTIGTDPLSGTVTIDQGNLSSADTPTVTASDGTSSVTATWDAPNDDASASRFSFHFATLAPGDWTITLSVPADLSLVLVNSSVPLRVLSDATTSGPFTANTVDQLPIGTWPTNLTVELTPSA